MPLLTIAQRKQTLLSPNYASILSPSHEKSFLIICHGYQLSPTHLQITLVVEAGYISLNCFMNSYVKKKGTNWLLTTLPCKSITSVLIIIIHQTLKPLMLPFKV